MIKNQTFYTTSFKKYGVSPRGLSWNSKENQEIRFETLTKLLKNELKESHVVDAGCGFGDLYLYWEKKGLKPKSYIGIDSFGKFISIAAQRVANVAFIKKDILIDTIPMADWYIASGSLNILSDFDTWLFLEKMLLHSHQGIAFNILCGEKRSEVFNYKTMEDIKEFAKTKKLTCNIITGYLKDDMSVILKREKE